MKATFAPKYAKLRRTFWIIGVCRGFCKCTKKSRCLDWQLPHPRLSGPPASCESRYTHYCPDSQDILYTCLKKTTTITQQKDWHQADCDPAGWRNVYTCRPTRSWINFLSRFFTHASRSSYTLVTSSTAHGWSHYMFVNLEMLEMLQSFLFHFTASKDSLVKIFFVFITTMSNLIVF